MRKRESSAFAELLSIFLYTDYRFPMLEAFAFVFVTTVLLFSSVNVWSTASAFQYMTGFSGFSLTTIVFVIVILKNIAYGLGGDFEKGTMQTFLTYPLTRWKVILARLCSSIFVGLALMAIAQFSFVFLIAPSFALGQFWMLVLGFLVSMSTPLLITAVVILTVLWVKSGGVPLALGIMLYFVIPIFSLLVLQVAYSQQIPGLAWLVYFVNPVYAFMDYYNSLTVGPIIGFGSKVPPTFGQAVDALAVNLVLSIGLIALGIFLFMRRVET